MVKVCKAYGLPFALVNLVKNEMKKEKTINEKGIFDKAKSTFPDLEFGVVDICDLIYHLKS